MPLYEIERGARPPRLQVRIHYRMTRGLVEQKIPMVTNLPNIEQMVPRLPESAPTLPREAWGYIQYPYDIAMRLAGQYASGAPSPTPTSARVKTV